jgi:hypothetical protein
MGPARFKSRQFCSPKCSGDSRATVAKSKPCEHCAKVMDKPDGYSFTSWRATRFCSRSCSGKHHRDQVRDGTWKPRPPRERRKPRSTPERLLLRDAVRFYAAPEIAAVLRIPVATLRRWHDENGAALLSDEDRGRLRALVTHAREVAKLRPGVPDDGRDVTEEGVPLYRDDSRRSVWAISTDQWEVW